MSYGLPLPPLSSVRGLEIFFLSSPFLTSVLQLDDFFHSVTEEQKNMFIIK